MQLVFDVFGTVWTYVIAHPLVAVAGGLSAVVAVRAAWQFSTRADENAKLGNLAKLADSYRAEEAGLRRQQLVELLEKEQTSSKLAAPSSTGDKGGLAAVTLSKNAQAILAVGSVASGKTQLSAMFMLAGRVTSSAKETATLKAVQKELETEAGQLVERIPKKMIVGVREAVEIRIGRKDISVAKIGLGLVGGGDLTQHSLDVLESMSVELLAPNGGFEIEGASPTTQLVRREMLAGSPFASASDEWAKWLWNVTPTRSGIGQLAIRVSAPMLDSRGVQTSATLPDREITIDVSVNYRKNAKSLALSGGKVAAGGVVTAVLGILTRDYWWPHAEAVLKKLGWL